MNAEEPRIYPCDECGVLRTKSEGGTIFTVCDACWNRLFTVCDACRDRPHSPEQGKVTMRIKDLEQMFATMDGGRLLEELMVFAAMHLDAHHNKEEDNIEAIVRAIQARLAETGIAQKHHGEACRFMLGNDRCPCSSAHWSWPRKGLPPRSAP